MGRTQLSRPATGASTTRRFLNPEREPATLAGFWFRIPSYPVEQRRLCRCRNYQGVAIMGSACNASQIHAPDQQVLRGIHHELARGGHHGKQERRPRAATVTILAETELSPVARDHDAGEVKDEVKDKSTRPHDSLSEWNIPARKKIFIAGPCSVESEEQMLRTAMQLSAYDVALIRGGVWKPRTRPGAFEGVGAKGLVWLKRAGNAAGLPVATEVASPTHVEECLKAGVDVLWIGARTTTSPFAVQEIADALRGVDIPVMIKNPMNPDIELWIGALERINKAGITKIMAVHRGFSTYGETLYRNQPIWRIPIELRRRLPHLPLICDPSHICGKQKYVMAVAQEAIDLLFDGLMIEVHCAPRRALSDSGQQMTPAQYGGLVRKLRHVSSSDPTHLPEVIKLLRREIDAIDDNLIALLAKRMECVERIGIWKRKHNVSLFQPERWEQILQDRIQSSVRQHLSASFVQNLFEHIHEEALNIQGRVRAERFRSRRRHGVEAFTAEHFGSGIGASAECHVAEWDLPAQVENASRCRGKEDAAVERI